MNPRRPAQSFTEFPAAIDREIERQNQELLDALNETDADESLFPEIRRAAKARKVRGFAIGTRA